MDGQARLTSSQLQVDCYPGHGFLVASIVDLRSGVDLLWVPQGADYSSLCGDLGPTGEASIGWFDESVFAGGWFPMFPTAGLPGAAQDVAWMHGEAPRLPWNPIEVTPTSVVCEVRTPVSGFALSRKVFVDGPTVTIRTTARNLGGRPKGLTLGEHPCFSRAVFAGGRISFRTGVEVATTTLAQPASARYRAPQTARWPLAATVHGDLEDAGRIPDRADGRHDHLIVSDTGGEATLTDRDGRFEVRLTWDEAAMPHALLWQHFRPQGSPWSGDTFAIEPMSVAARTGDDFDPAQVTIVPPGVEIGFWLALTVQSTPTCDSFDR